MVWILDPLGAPMHPRIYPRYRAILALSFRSSSYKSSIITYKDDIYSVKKHYLKMKRCPYFPLPLGDWVSIPRVMFPCACSLRSTQCAALIALASVAGLARFERTEPNSGGAKITAATQIVPAREACLDAWAHAVAIFFASGSYTFGQESVMPSKAACAAEVPPGQTEGLENPSDYAPPRNLPAANLMAEAASPFGHAELALKPSCRDHVIPFAVGPPALGRPSKTHFAAGTKLPGDSAAGGVKVSRIVGFSPEVKDPWIICPAVNPIRTGSALRGELASPVSAVPDQATACFGRHHNQPDATRVRRTAQFLS